jgi:type IV secretory pathway VirB2 component (pilin)
MSGPGRRARRVSLGPASLADPDGSNPVAAAVQWLEGTLLGNVATSVAVVCVAWIGLMMLSGRMDLRRAAGVILGSFILFGAPGIAAGLMALAGSGAGAGETAPSFAAPPYIPPPPPPPPPPPAPRRDQDPFAGATVPW